MAVILRNLVSNAVKFSYPGGGITLRIAQEGDQTAVHIADEGKGMTAAQINSLFSAWQNPAYGTGGERGTGLGLMLCREFAQLNGGFITVESTPDAGAHFTLHLPAGAAPLVES